MQTIKITDIMSHIISRYKAAPLGEERDLLETAINELDWSIDQPDKREDAVIKFVGSDPYCWLVIPNFAEIEESGDEEIAVDYGDKEDGIYYADLLY